MSKNINTSFRLHEISDILINDLQQLLSDKEQSKITIHREFNSKIAFQSQFHDPCFRVHISVDNPPHFVVSVVNLKNQHQGTMTQAFELIKQYCQSTNITVIEIQSVISEPMRSWCRKNAFDPNQSTCWHYYL